MLNIRFESKVLELKSLVQVCSLFINCKGLGKKKKAHFHRLSATTTASPINLTGDNSDQDYYGWNEVSKIINFIIEISKIPDTITNLTESQHLFYGILSELSTKEPCDDQVYRKMMPREKEMAMG